MILSVQSTIKTREQRLDGETKRVSALKRLQCGLFGSRVAGRPVDLHCEGRAKVRLRDYSMGANRSPDNMELF